MTETSRQKQTRKRATANRRRLASCLRKLARHADARAIKRLPGIGAVAPEKSAEAEKARLERQRAQDEKSGTTRTRQGTVKA